jgi:hypothetical protein
MQSQPNADIAAEPLRFVRTSSEGRQHCVAVDSVSLRLLGCDCLAGRRAQPCWASLRVMLDDLLPIARRRWLASSDGNQRHQAAHTYGELLRQQAAVAHAIADRPATACLAEGGISSPADRLEGLLRFTASGRL